MSMTVVQMWHQTPRCPDCFLPKKARDGDHTYPNCPHVDRSCRVCDRKGHIAALCKYRYAKNEVYPGCERCSRYRREDEQYGLKFHRLSECPEFDGCFGPNCKGSKKHLPKRCPDTNNRACYGCGSHLHEIAACDRAKADGLGN